MLNKSRKRIRLQSKTRIKRRLRISKRKTNKKGGQTQPLLSINYANIRIGGQELDRDEYLKTPQISLSNYAVNFIVTLTDPDAPAGTWTHYVAVLKPNGLIVSEPYKYEPPNPPPKTGTHHYIFRAYAATGTDALRNKKNLPGNEYYTQVLLPFIRNNKPLAEEKTFTVTSA
jgi:phosphatidylethanolamine-binding protein (PEBP) family uncharacterized protein